MIELEVQQLIFRAKRWPWKWFPVFARSAAVCRLAIDKFNALETDWKKLESERQRLAIESESLRKQKLEEAEKHSEQTRLLREDVRALKLEIQSVKLEASNAERARLASMENEKLVSLELKAMREERANLITRHDQMKDGVHTLFEFIRRKNLTDHRGQEIPKLPRFPNILGK